MSDPRVSVLMTVYNRADTLAAAIESVLAQSFREFELIVVDDVSADDSFSVAQRYISDNRVRVVRNESNLGDYPNRNRAASLATGRYLKYADSDDLLYPRCLEHFVAAMEAYPDTGLAVSDHARTNWWYPIRLEPREAYLQEFLGESRIFGQSATGTCIRREAFEAVGGFSGARHYGDSECWLKLAARWPVLLMGPGLVFCRRHGESETGVRSRKPEVFRKQREMVEGMLRDDRSPLSGEERDRAIALFRAEYLRRQLGWLRSGRKDLRFFLGALAGMRLGWKDFLALRSLRRDASLSREIEIDPTFKPNWSIYPGVSELPGKPSEADRKVE